MVITCMVTAEGKEFRGAGVDILQDLYSSLSSVGKPPSGGYAPWPVALSLKVFGTDRAGPFFSAGGWFLHWDVRRLWEVSIGVGQFCRTVGYSVFCGGVAVFEGSWPTLPGHFLVASQPWWWLRFKVSSTVILDYLYGIAAYKAWRSKRGDGFNQMKAYRNEHYAQIPPPPRAPPDGIDDTDVTSGPGDPNDSDYITPPTTETLHSNKEEQKEIEREERAAQEASRSKVMEWRNGALISDYERANNWIITLALGFVALPHGALIRLIPNVKLQLISKPEEFPAHWSAKCDYLHGKRGTEKPPFQLPSYIASTDIVTQRDAIKEKEAKMSFQAKTRERVQPRIGKIDIDYQKLHVANFRQSRPTRSPPRPGPPRTVSVGALFRFSTSSPHKAAIPKPWSNTFAASTMNRVGLLVKEIGILSCRSGAAEIGPADARGGPTDCDTLELMYGLVKNIKVVMDGGSVLMDGVHRTLGSRTYARERYFENHKMMSAMDKLHKLYASTVPPVVWARSTGVEVLNELDTLKAGIIGAACGRSSAGIVPGSPWGMVASGVETLAVYCSSSQG
ncbi:protein of unknown function (DUF382) domain containing protein [Russula decolorans]